MRKFSLRLLLSTIQRFRVTSLFLAPPVVLMLVESDLLSQYDLSSVELLLCGGAPLQPEQSRKLEAVFGDGRVRSRQGWGMTEATMAVTLFAPDEFDPSHKGVGYLVANMQMKIVADDGSQVGYCEEGEAFVRGPNVFKGYYKNQSASQQAFDWMGWMRTGDIVTIQRSGLVTVVNRKKVATMT
jgi:4-coumarate--CoA ligase